MKTRHANSAESLVKAMTDTAKPPLVAPAHVRLRDGDLPFWDGVVRARGRDEWSECDLVVAAQLTRCQADIERESMLLDEQGTTVTNARGTEVLNPRVTVLEQLARREMALMRCLRMGGKAAGDPRNEAGRRKVQKQAEDLREELEDEELLAS